MRNRIPAAGPWFALFALVIVGGWHWARIESPRIPLIEMVVMCAIAIAPTLVAQLRGRTAGLVTLVIAIPLAIGSATGMWPGSSGAHSYPVAVERQINDGAHTWFNATTPFDYGRFGSVDADARLLFMAIVAVLAWTLVLRRWTLTSIALALVLFAFPSTVLDLGHPWLRAAVFLAAALLALRLVPRHSAQSSGGGGSGQAWALGTAVVVLGLVVASLPGINKGAFMSWHTWDPLAATAAPRSLSYVWDQSYAPLHWHGKPTPVLNVWSSKPGYWKLATLETFDGEKWTEVPRGQQESPSDGQLAVPSENLSGDAQHPKPVDVNTVRVQVLALADSHLITLGQPLKWYGPDGTPFTLRTDSTAVADADLPRGTSYSSIVYAPDPSVNKLIHAGTHFPDFVTPDRRILGVNVPAYPQPPGYDSSNVILAPELVKASNEVWAKSSAAEDSNEYSAAVDVEAYFRSKPFTYDLTPKFSGGSPILAQFMLTGHRGYCQMFSGSMALVLRMHGIPARVAEGFTTGQPPTTANGPYVVSDRDAHAWVEVYFPGIGWQPFDPTPTRHLPVKASASNPLYAKTVLPTATVKGQHGGPIGPAALKVTSTATRPPSHGIKGKGDVTADGHGGSFTAAQPSGGHGFFTWLAVLLVVLVVLVGIAKFVAVRWRYLRRGPRAQASAAYRELATFVGDQGVEDSPERTFEDLSKEITRVFGVDASDFAAHASRARYAPDAQAEPASRAMRGDLRGLKRSIRKQLSLRDRFVGALRVRSALAQVTSLD